MRMNNERPYRLALLGTSPVSDGGKLNAVNQKPPLPQRGRWHAQRDGGGSLDVLDAMSL